MASTPDIQIVPLDFDSIRGDIKRFLQSQSEFRDYNFEGSALSLLIDILAYDAFYHGWYTNFAVNESFLQTAQVRNSVVAAARQVGYVPRSVTGSKAEVDITIGSVLPGEGLLILPKYSSFTSNVSGNTFTFYTLSDTTVFPQGANSVTLSGIELHEGVLLTQTYDITTSNYSNTGTVLQLLNQNIDTQTVSVSVSVDDTPNSPTFEYSRATSAVTVNASSNVFFLFESNRGDYEIQFGDDYLGHNVVPGNQVVVRALNSRGSSSVGANEFVYTGDPLGSASETSNVTVALSNVNIPAYGGAPRESIDSIKRNAPAIYQVQGRVVTPDDAKTILLTEVSGIDSLSVWGGEDHDPPTYGKMYVCMKPVDAFRFGSTQKNRIIRDVLRPKSSPIISYEAVDPDYIYVVADTAVRYTSALTSLTARELQQQVLDAISNYAQFELGQFGSFFRYSQLLSAIDNADLSIQSSATKLLLEKRFIIESGTTSYTVKFSNPILTEFPVLAPTAYANIVDEETQRITSVIQDIGLVNLADSPARLAYAEEIIRAAVQRTANTAQQFVPASVTSKVGAQLFSHPNENGTVEQFCWVQNEGTALHVYKTDANTAVRKVKSDVGTVNFDTGTVQFTNFTPTVITTSNINEFRLRAIPVSLDVAPVRDQIILMPMENVTVAVIEDLLNRRNTTTGRGSLSIR